jgi:hypothetical protein
LAEGNQLMLANRCDLKSAMKALRGDLLATAAVLFIVAVMLWFMP